MSNPQQHIAEQLAGSTARLQARTRIARAAMLAAKAAKPAPSAPQIDWTRARVELGSDYAAFAAANGGPAA